MDGRMIALLLDLPEFRKGHFLLAREPDTNIAPQSVEDWMAVYHGAKYFDLGLAAAGYSAEEDMDAPDAQILVQSCYLRPNGDIVYRDTRPGAPPIPENEEITAAEIFANHGVELTLAEPLMA